MAEFPGSSVVTAIELTVDDEGSTDSGSESETEEVLFVVMLELPGSDDERVSVVFEFDRDLELVLEGFFQAEVFGSRDVGEAFNTAVSNRPRHTDADTLGIWVAKFGNQFHHFGDDFIDPSSLRGWVNFFRYLFPARELVFGQSDFGAAEIDADDIHFLGLLLSIVSFFGLLIHYLDFMKRVVVTESAPKAVGPYSQAIVAGNLVFCSGQIAIDPVTNELISGGVQEQTHRVMDNLKAVLEAAGSSLEQVVKVTIFLQDMNDYAVVNEVYGSYFAGDAPARECVEVARLPKDVQVEISLVSMV